MRTILVIALAITFMSAGSASAQIVDMNTVTARLAVYCGQNPTHSLTTAAEPIMEQK